MSMVGVSDFKYALLTADTPEGVTYGEWTRIPSLNKISVNPSSNTATNYGDNGPVESAESLGEVSISADICDIPDKDRAALLGHKLVNGVMEYNSEDVAPYAAIMFTGLNSNGTRKFVKVLKVKFSEPKDEYTTKEDKVTFSNPQIEGKAVIREYDKAWKRTLDEGAEGVTPEIVSKFTETVE